MSSERSVKNSPQETADEGSFETFALQSPFLSHSFSHHLQKAEYTALRRSQQFLLTYMQFEESVLQILFASQHFEEYLLHGALEYYLFTTHDFDYFQNMRLKANLHVAGVLNSITGFRDQFPTFRGLTGAFKARTVFLERWDELQGRSVALKFGEALRNYAQHESQPVSGATTGGGWDEDRVLMESHLTVYASVAPILSDRRVRADVREEIEAEYGDRADLALILREMLGAIGSLVKQSRDDLEPYYEEACVTYQKALDDVAGYSERFVVADAVAIRSGEVVEKFSVFRDFVKRAKRLRATTVMVNNEKHFISNRARGHRTKH